MGKNKLWNNIQEKLKDNIFSLDILNKFINNFYDFHIQNLSPDQHILFIIRIELTNGDIKTASNFLN